VHADSAVAWGGRSKAIFVVCFVNMFVCFQCFCVLSSGL
jgi:hypothetical protein